MALALDKDHKKIMWHACVVGLKNRNVRYDIIKDTPSTQIIRACYICGVLNPD